MLAYVLDSAEDETAPAWTQFGMKLVKAIQEGVGWQWTELRTLEMALDRVAAEFNGEDVLKPRLRQDIEEAKQQAVEIYTAIQDFTGPFELADADPQRVEKTLDLINKWADNRA